MTTDQDFELSKVTADEVNDLPIQDVRARLFLISRMLYLAQNHLGEPRTTRELFIWRLIHAGLKSDLTTEGINESVRGNEKLLRAL